ncbi:MULTISPECIES: hypothetical protein [unclassified Ruegeria]|uniref:hypothetical protein n=1 Tax=unclassified Ruegeria TaxID=2625375 RepID=UPI0014889AD5|nr:MULTISPECIES: hypothetical protein [unclassified Ruegeria]NOD35034.1 hypothetical protein [Ruegeria sp. HKCCD7296]NOE41989.1 hypothetical protein [Ruegeria sp. HKCCD7319]
MYKEYDNSLHTPLKWRSIETQPQELDEEKLDAAIANLMEEQRELDELAALNFRTEFPRLLPQKEVTNQAASKQNGLSAILRQKWAELSGAA